MESEANDGPARSLATARSRWGTRVRVSTSMRPPARPPLARHAAPSSRSAGGSHDPWGRRLSTPNPGSNQPLARTRPRPFSFRFSPGRPRPGGLRPHTLGSSGAASCASRDRGPHGSKRTSEPLPRGLLPPSGAVSNKHRSTTDMLAQELRRSWRYRCGVPAGGSDQRQPNGGDR